MGTVDYNSFVFGAGSGPMFIRLKAKVLSVNRALDEGSVKVVNAGYYNGQEFTKVPFTYNCNQATNPPTRPNNAFTGGSAPFSINDEVILKVRRLSNGTLEIPYVVGFWDLVVRRCVPRYLATYWNIVFRITTTPALLKLAASDVQNYTYYPLWGWGEFLIRDRTVDPANNTWIAINISAPWTMSMAECYTLVTTSGELGLEKAKLLLKAMAATKVANTGTTQTTGTCDDIEVGPCHRTVVWTGNINYKKSWKTAAEEEKEAPHARYLKTTNINDFTFDAGVTFNGIRSTEEQGAIQMFEGNMADAYLGLRLFPVVSLIGNAGLVEIDCQGRTYSADVGVYTDYFPDPILEYRQVRDISNTESGVTRIKANGIELLSANIIGNSASHQAWTHTIWGDIDVEPYTVSGSWNYCLLGYNQYDQASYNSQGIQGCLFRPHAMSIATVSQDTWGVLYLVNKSSGTYTGDTNWGWTAVVTQELRLSVSIRGDIRHHLIWTNTFTANWSGTGATPSHSGDPYIIECYQASSYQGLWLVVHNDYFAFQGQFRTGKPNVGNSGVTWISPTKKVLVAGVVDIRTGNLGKTVVPLTSNYSPDSAFIYKAAK